MKAFFRFGIGCIRTTKASNTLPYEVDDSHCNDGGYGVFFHILAGNSCAYCVHSRDEHLSVHDSEGDDSCMA